MIGPPDHRPIEETHPELAEHLRQIANGVHPTVRALNFEIGHHLYILKNGQRKRIETERNDPCPCGSGKKYKKCHLFTRK